MRNKFVVGTLLLLMIAILAGCGDTDVIASSAKSSFERMQNAAGAVKQGGNTVIVANGGQIFEYGTGGTKIKLPAAPFLEAGLLPDKLPDAITVEGGYIVIEKDYQGSSFSEIVDKYRQDISYHQQLDHYGIKMGDGIVFEWAKDIETNDKDIVFVLDPKVLKDAGIDVENIKGYAYLEVEQMDKTKAFKVLAPFDLK